MWGVMRFVYGSKYTDERAAAVQVKGRATVRCGAVRYANSQSVQQQEAMKIITLQLSKDRHCRAQGLEHCCAVA